MTGWKAILAGSARREVAAAGLLALALFLVGTAQIPILGLDEGRFSQAAREMLDRGDPVVPTFVGEGRYHKPILVYWLTMASYTAFGVTERAARLPANLAGAMAVMLLAWSARRRFGPGAGVLAGGLLAVTMVFHVQAKACTADMILLLPTLAVMLAFERIVAGSDDWRLSLAFWLGMAVAILAKGPIAPLWVLATAVALWAFDHHWKPWELSGLTALLLVGAWSLGPVVLIVPAVVAGRHVARSPGGRDALRRFRFGWGLPLMLGLILPWIVAVELATEGAFLREAIGKHILARSVSAFESHGFFPGFYILSGPIVAFPWFAVVFSALARGRALVGSGAYRFLLAWLVGPWIVLELVQTKLVHYWMPSYPAGILMVVGCAMAAGTNRWVWGAPTRYLLLLSGLVVASVPLAVTLYLGVPDTWTAAAVATFILAGATIAAVLLARRSAVRALVMVAAGIAVFHCVLFGAHLPGLAAHSLPVRAGGLASELVRPDERVVVFKPRDDDLFFYLPVDSGKCPGAGCMADLWRGGQQMLGMARDNDFKVLKAEWREVNLVEVERVDGLDLNRAKRAEIVIFRIVNPLREAHDIDSKGAPS